MGCGRRRQKPPIKWRKLLHVDVMNRHDSIRAELWCSVLVFIFLSLFLKDTKNYEACQPVPTGQLDLSIALKQLEMKQTVTSD